MFLILGFLFGIILVKAEVISWYRIHEMFHFQSFHMYGIMGSAIATGMLSIYLIRKYRVKTVSGGEVQLTAKEYTPKANLTGGIIFGIGWALTGACPGPIYALIGTGLTVFVVVLAAAVLGALAYGLMKDKLPH